MAAFRLTYCLFLLPIGCSFASGAQALRAQAPKSVTSEAHSDSSSKACNWTKEYRKRIDEVVDAALALQTPLASNSLIQISEKLSSKCPSRAEAILNQAFDLAENVSTQFGFQNVLITGHTTDSRTNYTWHGYELKMDQLSLRSRVVLSMSKINPPAAVKLFQKMVPPRPSASTCSSAFVPNVSIYYDAFDELQKNPRALVRTETDEHAPLLDLPGLVSATVSPVQVAPLAKVIIDAKLPTNELTSTLNGLAGAIEGLPADENSFFFGGTFPAGKAKTELIQLAIKSESASQPLAHAFHDYLQRTIDGRQCAQVVQESFSNLMERFELYNRSPIASETEPLTVPDSAPKIEPSPDDGEYWLTEKTRILLVEAKHLNFDDAWKPFTTAQKNTPEWRDRVQHLLDDMDDWKATDEPEATDYFHERCMLLYRTLSQLPPGSLYDRVLSVYIRSFEDSPIQWDAPAEWYFEITRFLNFSRKGDSGPIPPEALMALKNSGNERLRAVGVVTEFLQRTRSGGTE